jgi:peptidyl-prolyl cis-trans isomerase C
LLAQKSTQLRSLSAARASPYSKASLHSGLKFAWLALLGDIIMHRAFRLLLLLPTATLLLWACDDAAQQRNTADVTGKVVATVNGTAITARELNAYVERRQAAQPGVPVNRKEMLNELVRLEVLKQQAERAGVDERSDIQAELDWQRTNLLVNTFVREHMDNMSFSEKELRTEYDQQVERLPEREYKARHILTETRQQADAMIERLEKGADFVALSEKASTAPSAPEGGSLGWFSPAAMVPPFAEALANLKKGAYTKQPVKTRFGWHVILLEDVRKQQPPKYAKVKERLRDILTSRALNLYIDKLRDNAKVKIKAPFTPEGPAQG